MFLIYRETSRRKTMNTYIWIIFLATNVVCLVNSCPTMPCRCDDKRKIVYCNERNLVRVPNAIPPDTKVLLLQGNSLESTPHLEETLSQLTQLERLDMHDNKLTSFPDSLPSSLIYLSLRLNFIKFVGRNVMDNLYNLKDLQLDSNNLTNRGLASNAFSYATSLDDLALSNNKLTSFPPGLPTSLKSLRLSNNKMNYITPQSLQPLRNLHILDLSYNELTGDLQGLNQLDKLQVLDLNNNLLMNLPVEIPRNLTELRLSANKIQYIYTSRGDNHGDLQFLSKLKKLDISSNHLRSVEKGSFNALPRSLSLELQNNPWGCDCNLVYLKRWLTYTTTIPASGDVKCATPPEFSGVTLEAIDTEALTCTHLSYDVAVKRVEATNAIIEYNADQEPPYVTYSAMYGIMLCKDCSLPSDTSSSASSRARMWMEDYTIIPLVSGVPTEITDLKSNTRYAVCVVTSYQHPDLIGIEQCEDIKTLSIDVTTPERNSEPVALPIWAVVIIVGMVCLTLIVALAALVIRYRRHRARSPRSFIANRNRRFGAPQPYVAGKGLPLIDANTEFDVTLMVRKDLKRQSDSCYSESHDESLSTTHTGTLASRSSNHAMKYDSENAEYLHPLQTSVLPPVADNVSVKYHNNSGLFV